MPGTSTFQAELRIFQNTASGYWRAGTRAFRLLLANDFRTEVSATALTGSAGKGNASPAVLIKQRSPVDRPWARLPEECRQGDTAPVACFCLFLRGVNKAGETPALSVKAAASRLARASLPPVAIRIGSQYQ